MQSAASKLIAELEQVDFQKLSASISQTLASISQLVTSPQLKLAVNNLATTEASLGQAATGIRQATLQLNKEIAPLASSLRVTSQAATVALAQARTTLASMQDSFGEDSPLVYQTGKTIQDLDNAARAARQLTELLERDPSVMVRGRYFPGTAH